MLGSAVSWPRHTEPSQGEPLSQQDHLQIGEVAARTELSIKTIRHYDEVGLVTPSARSAGGFRLYTANDVNRLLAIRRMKPSGFSLDEMRELLDALDTLDSPGASAAQRAEAAEYLAECHTRAQEACVKLTRQLAYAQELTEQLARYRS
ncbi:MerR family transcriptional regulator [Mycolicibacterium sp. (ex Dasyatis americana)]|nr:MerR family transcriptional regulator [Mycolicibacterium sp. (ex Dasyatis americana)]